MKTIFLVFTFYSFLFGQYFFLPESNTKILEVEQLKGKSKEFFRFARNEIFARHGYVFKDSDLNTFFNKMEWYKPNNKPDLNLIEIEKHNVELLKSLEKAQNTVIMKYYINIILTIILYIISVLILVKNLGLQDGNQVASYC